MVYVFLADGFEEIEALGTVDILRRSELDVKTVSINEKVDEKLIGGIVIDYGSKRYDGSVKSRLDALKGELGSVI